LEFVAIHNAIHWRRQVSATQAKVVVVVVVGRAQISTSSGGSGGGIAVDDGDVRR